MSGIIGITNGPDRSGWGPGDHRHLQRHHLHDGRQQVLGPGHPEHGVGVVSGLVVEPPRNLVTVVTVG